jgi:hypothetical protein
MRALIIISMSKSRVVKDEIWDDDWFYELDPTEKLVWLFLLTNPRGNIAGIYKLNQKWAAQSVGLDFDVFKTILQRFVRDGKIIYEDNWVALVNFHRHVAYRNASVAQGIVRLYREGTGCPQSVYSVWLTLLNSTLLYLSDKDDKSPSLKKEINQIITMGWKKYNEDGHNEYTPSIDLDSNEEIQDEQSKQTEENKKITNNLKVLGEYRGIPFADVPTQRKKYNEILKLGYTHLEIADEFVKLIDSPYWKEQKVTSKLLPDLKSLHSGLKNKIK